MAKPHPEPFPQRSPPKGGQKKTLCTLSKKGLPKCFFVWWRGGGGGKKREGGEDQKGRCGRLRGKEWKIKKEGGQDKREGGKIRGKEGGEDKRRQEE